MDTITVRYTQDKQWWSRTIAARRQLHPVRWYFRIGVVLLLLCYPFILKDMTGYVFGFIGLSLGAATILRDYRMGKELLRGPNGGKEGILRFSPDRLEISIGESKSEMPIADLQKVKIVPLGLAIYPTRRAYQLIPRDSFETEEEMQTVLRYWEEARAKAAPPEAAA